MASPVMKAQKREEYKPTISILSYGAGNIRSLTNAIERIGFEYRFIEDPMEIEKAEVRLESVQSAHELMHRSFSSPESATSVMYVPHYAKKATQIP